MGAVAKRFPNTRFAIVDVANGDLAGKPKNVLGLLFREEQVGYLAGYLAGLEAKRLPGQGRGQLGRGREAAAGRPLRRRLPGGREEGGPERHRRQRLLAGLQRPGEVQGDRAEPDRRRVASRCSQVAGGCGLGALDAARERKVWGIGVDADQSFLGPHILTSATKKVDRAVFLAIKSVQDGTVPRRRRRLRAEAGRRRAREDQPAGCRRAEVAAVKRIQAQLVAGTIVPPKRRCTRLAEPYARRMMPSSAMADDLVARSSRPRASTSAECAPSAGGGERVRGPLAVDREGRPERRERRRAAGGSRSPRAAGRRRPRRRPAPAPPGTLARDELLEPGRARVLAEAAPRSPRRAPARFATRSGFVAKRGSSASSRQPDRLDEPPEDPVVRGGDHQPAVRRREDLVRRDRVEGRPLRRRHRRRSRSSRSGGTRRTTSAVSQSETSSVCPPPCVQRGQDRRTPRTSRSRGRSARRRPGRPSLPGSPVTEITPPAAWSSGSYPGRSPSALRGRTTRSCSRRARASARAAPLRRRPSSAASPGRRLWTKTSAPSTRRVIDLAAAPQVERERAFARVRRRRTASQPAGERRPPQPRLVARTAARP